MHEQYPIDLAARRQIAESLLGEIDPRGYCHCPGELEHSNKSGRGNNRIGRDCRVYLEASAQNPRGVPTIVCVHTSCGGAVAEANHKLRSLIAKHEASSGSSASSTLPNQPDRRRRKTREEKEREVEQALAVRLAKRAAMSLPQILEEYEWSAYDIYEASSMRSAIPEDGAGQARALLSLFRPEDVVWCGEHQDSIAADEVNDPKRAKRVEALRARAPFRTASEWIEAIAADGVLPGPRICPSAFKPGGLSRSNEAVLARRFLVIEHDRLGMAEQGALLRWLTLRVFQPAALRAIVWTGGKSMHGWFDSSNLSTARLKELETVLCGVRVTKLGGGSELVGGLGFDPATFVPSQAYRVPGWKHERTGERSALLYLAKEER